MAMFLECWCRWITRDTMESESIISKRVGAKFLFLYVVFYAFFQIRVDAVFSSLEPYRLLQFPSDLTGEIFTHFAIDNDSGFVYIGGKIMLYQLYPDFSLYQKVSTEPASNECGRQCENINIILAIAQSPTERLITCGSFSGQCEMRILRNISDSAPSRQSMINRLTSAVGVITTDGYLYLGVGPQYYPKSPITYITKWQSQPGHSNSFAEIDAISYPSSDAEHQEFDISFLAGFTLNGFIYFATNQQQLIYQRGSSDPVADHPYVPKIIRICSQTSYTDFDEFTEVPLMCSDAAYNLIQAMELSFAGKRLDRTINSYNSDVLYALFAKADETSKVATKDSVLCIYQISDLDEKFVDTVYKCLTEGSCTYGAKHLDSSCSALVSSNLRQLDKLVCLKVKYCHAQD